MVSITSTENTSFQESTIQLNSTEKDQNTNFYNPKLYQDACYGFCANHLFEYPLACGECYYSADHEIEPSHELNKSSYYVDTELLNRAAPYKKAIPKIESICRFCLHDCVKIEQHFPVDLKGENHPVYRTIKKTEEGSIKYKTLVLFCECCAPEETFFTNTSYSSEIENFKHSIWSSVIKCENLSVPAPLFDISSTCFSDYFIEYLKLRSDNEFYKLLSPSESYSAFEISDLVYSEFKSGEIYRNLKNLDFEGLDKEMLQTKTNFDVLKLLFVKCFLYSHYKKVLDLLDKALSLSEIEYNKDKIRTLIQRLQNKFLSLYECCSEKSPHPKIYHELGLLYFDIQEYEKAFDCFEKGLELDPNNKALKNSLEKLAEKNKNSEWLLKKMLLKQNLSTWTGLSFSKKAMSIQLLLAKGGCRSLWSFTKESAADIWSMLDSIYDLVFAPPEIKVEKVIELIEITKSIKNIFSKDGLSLIYDSCAKYVEEWETLPFNGKIEALGFALGSATLVSIEAAGAVKGLASLKKLTQLGKIGRTSNITRLQAKEIAIQVNKHLKRVEAYKKTTSLHKAKQLLHDVAAVNRNTQNPKSIVFLSMEEIEAATVSLMGKGIPLTEGSKFGDIGYKEILKFDRIIGEVHLQKSQVWIKTPFVKIHYKQNGLYHIVPYNPEGKGAQAWKKLYE